MKVWFFHARMSDRTRVQVSPVFGPIATFSGNAHKARTSTPPRSCTVICWGQSFSPLSRRHPYHAHLLVLVMPPEPRPQPVEFLHIFRPDYARSSTSSFMIFAKVGSGPMLKKPYLSRISVALLWIALTFAALRRLQLPAKALVLASKFMLSWRHGVGCLCGH